MAADYDGNANWNFKIGPNFLTATPLELLFVTGHEASHNWVYQVLPWVGDFLVGSANSQASHWSKAQKSKRNAAKSSLDDSNVLQIKGIDEFVADATSMAFLESLKTLNSPQAVKEIHDFITSPDLCESCGLTQGLQYFPDEAGRRLIGLALEIPRSGQWGELRQAIQKKLPEVQKTTSFEDFARDVVEEAWGVDAWKSLLPVLGNP